MDKEATRQLAGSEMDVDEDDDHTCIRPGGSKGKGPARDKETARKPQGQVEGSSTSSSSGNRAGNAGNVDLAYRYHVDCFEGRKDMELVPLMQEGMGKR